MKQPIKIAFSGIGGVGGYYGGRLANCFEKDPMVEIYFLARGIHLQHVAMYGLKVIARDRTFVAHPTLTTNKPTEVGVVDFLFLATKSYDLEDNVRALAPLIDQHTVIIPLLNGIGITERVRAIYPENRVWYGCCYIISDIQEPGVIRELTVKNKLIFGSLDHDDPDVKRIADLFLKAKVNLVVPDDIIQAVWSKFFFISAAATLTSYYDCTYGDIVAHRYDEFLVMLNEILEIAEAAQVRLGGEEIEHAERALKASVPTETTSLHKDIKNRRRNELDSITGEVVRLGRKYGVPTPYFTKMYRALLLRQGE